MSPPVLSGASAGARRTRGLRREEVSRLLGVSMSWYTKLEQGLDVNPSPRLLGRIADVLRLSHVERMQLLQLGLEDAGPRISQAHEDELAAAQMVVDAMHCSPAFVLSPRSDYLACNAAARAVFGDFESFPGDSNQLLALFFDQNTRDSLPNWRESARRQVAMFRTAFARNIHDPGLQSFVSMLCERSGEFSELWEQYELPQSSSRDVDYRHRDGETYSFHHFTFFADFENRLRVEVFNPADERTLRWLAGLMT